MKEHMMRRILIKIVFFDILVYTRFFVILHCKKVHVIIK